MTHQDLLNRIERLFAERGAEEYHGEAVSQLEHALQAAALGRADGANPELIVAALLHDVGHLLQSHGEQAAERGIDDRHEALGQRFLEKYYPPEVTEPVRLHVAAKRYLCAIEPAYFDKLSPSSVLSLKLQGGPMNAGEVGEFEANPFGKDAARLRKWDDTAKIPGLDVPSLESYRKLIRAVLKGDSATPSS